MLEAFTRSRPRERVFLFCALSRVRMVSAPLRPVRHGSGHGDVQRTLLVFHRRLHSPHEPTCRAAA